MRFDGEYRERATLQDGRRVILRLLRPSDRDKLARGFYELSEEGRYRRFLSAKPRLSNAELDYLTDVDQQTHVAIGAVFIDRLGRECEGAGVARFVLIENEGEDDECIAEAAVTVTDTAQGVGLGTLLFQRLSEAATERGVRKFRGEVLATNEAMLKITRGIDAHIQPSIKAGIATIDIALPVHEASDGGQVTKKDGTLLRWFASGSAAIREFLTWRWMHSDEEE